MDKTTRRRELPYIKRQQLIWLAGLSEGEACFYGNKATGCPMYSISMVDRDVMEHIGQLLDADVKMYEKRKDTEQPYYTLRISGFKAAQVMELLRPHLFSRRQAKIDEILSNWKPKHKKLSVQEVNDIEALFSNGYTRMEIVDILELPYSAVQKILQGRKAA